MNLTIPFLLKKKIWLFSPSANKDKSSMLKMPILLRISRSDKVLFVENSLFSSLKKNNDHTLLK